MSYAYTNGDGVSALDKTTPDGSLEYVASLDDAIRQIKAYLVDPADGPDAMIGNLSALTTTAKGNLVAAVNELDTLITAADGEIGNLSSLSTTAKSNLVAAINEIFALIGALSSLSTTAKSSVVASINEIFARLSPAINSSGKLLAAAVTAGLITDTMLASGISGSKITNATLAAAKLTGTARSIFGTDGSGNGVVVTGSNGNYLRKNASTGNLEFAAVPVGVLSAWYSAAVPMPAMNTVAEASHGLGGIPRLVNVLFRAEPAVDSPLTEGQYLKIEGIQRQDGYEEDQSGIAVWYDDTKVYVRRGNENDFKVGGVSLDFDDFDVVIQAAI